MNVRDAARSALPPTVIAAAGIALASAVHQCTEARIEARARAESQQKLEAVLSASKFDNDILGTARRLEAGALGSPAPAQVYLARRHRRPVAAIFDMVAPDGYSGPIRLLIGVYYGGSVSGVRVVSHRETTGLGDAIEAGKSNWLDRFSGRSLDDPPADEWAVKEDGGAFDQISGATVTSRAMVGAVQRALVYFAAHKQALFGPPAKASDPAQR